MTPSKSRVSFLELQHAGEVDQCMNDAAIQYMAEHGLPPLHVVANGNYTNLEATGVNFVELDIVLNPMVEGKFQEALAREDFACAD